jgi:hypothetical protein
MGILVIGATGYVGSRLVTALLANGHQVVAGSRDPERLNRFGWSGDVTPVALDASDPASLITGVALPVPQGLAGDLVESLDHPMVASASGLRGRVPDPPRGLLGIDDAITLALADRTNRGPRPVNALSDPHRLADSDPGRAGGDAPRIRRLARAITPPLARPTLRLVNKVPGPLAGALRTGLDVLIALTPKVHQ